MYAPSFWGDRIVGVGWADNKVLVQDASGAPYQNTVTEWLTWGDGSFMHFIRAAVAPNGTTFAYTAYDSEPEPDGPPFLVLGKYTSGQVPGAAFESCEFPTAPNPTKVTFSPDSSLMAWKDDQGIKVVAVPSVPSQTPTPVPCAPGTPTIISAAGEAPALGGIDVPALIAARAGAGGGTPGPVTTTTTPGGTTPPPTVPVAPRLTLSAPGSITIKKALRNGVKLELKADKPVTMTVRLVVRKADAKRLKLGTKDITIGSVTAKVGTTTKRVTVKIAAKWRKRLKKAKRVVIAIRISGTSADGRRSTAARALTLKR